MTEEREVILKTVLPKLVGVGHELGVRVSPVDLRWGITREQTESGNTINICLSEIDKCRPYFVCILGGRYGWSQPSNPKSPQDSILRKSFDLAAERFGWIRNYQDRSVTELEVRHAVLNDINSQTAQNALFYIKPGDDDDLRLSNLKSEINLAGSLTVNEYQTAFELGTSLAEALEQQIRRDFPLSQRPSPIEADRFHHRIFEESLAEVYVGRQLYMDSVNAHLASSEQALIIITGSSGSGKNAWSLSCFLLRLQSAFLSNWSLQFRDSHPASLLLTHYVGATPHSSDVPTMLKRFMEEIESLYSLDWEIPKTASEILESFPRWLSEGGRRGGVYLVIDGIDQLDTENNYDLRWIPRTLPYGVFIILGGVANERLSPIISSNQCFTMTIQSLTQSEKRQLIREYLGLYGKTLNSTDEEIISSSSSCELPLYLRILLEEVRVFGSFETLTEEIYRLLNASDTQHLLQLSLQRIQRDSSWIGDSEMLSQFLGLLCVSRRGLFESEILEIMEISQAVLSSLIQAFGTYIVIRYFVAWIASHYSGGYIIFAHDLMRTAVAMQYLGEKEGSSSKSRKYREQLISACNTNIISKKRKNEELPWQYQQLGQLRQLLEFLTHPETFVEYLDSSERLLLYKYWRELHQLHPEQLLIDKILSIDDSLRAIELSSRVCSFFKSLGKYDYSFQAGKMALEMTQSHNSENKLLIAMKEQDLASVLQLMGNLSESHALFARALEVIRSAKNVDQRFLASVLDDGRSISLDHQLFLFKILLNSHTSCPYSFEDFAKVCRLRGEYSESERSYLASLRIRERLFTGPHVDVAQSYNGLGCLNQDMGKYEVSLKYLSDSLSIREALLGSNDVEVGTALRDLAALYMDWTLDIYMAAFGQNHPLIAKTLSSIAGIYNELGQYDRAEESYNQVMILMTGLHGNDHPDVALVMNDMGVLFTRQKRFDDAMRCYQESMNIRKRVLGENHPDYANSLKNIGALHQEMKNMDTAMHYFNQCLQITEKAFGPTHQDVASAIVNLAGCKQLMGDPKQALPLYERALVILIVRNTTKLRERMPICESYCITATSISNRMHILLTIQSSHFDHTQIKERAGPDHTDVALCLHDLAACQQRLGLSHDAEQNYLLSLKTYETVLGAEHITVGNIALNIAKFYYGQKQSDRARLFAQKAKSIYSLNLPQNDPKIHTVEEILCSTSLM